MRRREILAALGGALASPSLGQQPLPKIGILGSGSAKVFGSLISAFRRALDSLGFDEGQTVSFEYRWADGRYDLLPALAEELVRRGVAVIVAVGGDGPAQAAKAATDEIPIVFVSGGEPVKGGLVESLARPGGNATGVSFIAAALMTKRLELLHQLVPKIHLVGALVNPTYPDKALQEQELQDVSRNGQRVTTANASNEEELELAFATLVRVRADAVLIANDPFFYSQQAVIVELAARHLLPTFYFERGFVVAGGLASYGASLTRAFEQAAGYTGRILKGTKPENLPVLQPTVLELVINLKTATALGLTLPPSLLARADEVIE